MVRRPSERYAAITPLTELTPELVLKAYAFGVFPMARSRADAEFVWVKPKLRGILPLDGFHVSRTMKRILRRGDFGVTVDTAFERVVEGCADATPDRPETWINDPIFSVFSDLHRAGLAHSVEVWDGDELVGGIYGLAMGGAFFGESMFSRVDNASKVALCHAAGILKRGGFTLFDAQFITDHLKQFGAVEIGQQDYMGQLAGALAKLGVFQGPLEPDALLSELSHASTQTS